MLIFINFIGAVMMVLGILGAFFLGPKIGGNKDLLIAGPIMAACDLLYRSLVKSRLEDTSFFNPKRGGNIFWIPVWIIGLIVFVIGLCSDFSFR
jgi:hypothetical protein